MSTPTLSGRIRFVVDIERCRYYTDPEYAHLVQSILRKELGVLNLDVTMGAMPARLKCACGCNEETP